MVANNREDFLFQLHNELHRIGVDASSDIFSDFEEHFKASASEGLSEEETCRRLGDVKEIARNYIDIESSRINSIVAQAIEADRPHVSLTKPGRDVPADLSLVKDKEEKPSEPLPEYTPQHLSAVIYPNAQSQPAGGTQSAAGNTNTNTNAANAAAGGTADNSAQAGQTGQAGQPNQSLGDAFGAAGRAIGEAAKAAGHAIGEAFSADAVKTAGRNAAEAAKNAGGIVADKVKAAAENARNAHQANQTNQTHRAYQNGQPETAVPRPSDEAREYNSSDRRGEIPPQYGTKAGTGKGFTFKDVKGMKMNPSFGKLFGCICLDLFVWWWLIATLAAIAVEVGLGGFGWCVGHGLHGLFVGLGSYHIISRVFYGIAMISLGAILLLLGILLVKGIIKLVKHIVLMHVKALYDL